VAGAFGYAEKTAGREGRKGFAKDAKEHPKDLVFILRPLRPAFIFFAGQSPRDAGRARRTQSIRCFAACPD
jgi:hypothetical protein